MAKKWISLTRAFRKLHVSKETMLRIADREGLARRQLPGINRIEFLLEDIERIEQEAITVGPPGPQDLHAVPDPRSNAVAI